MMKLSIFHTSNAKPAPLAIIDERTRRQANAGRCRSALLVLVALLGVTARQQPAAALTLPESIPDFSQDTSRPAVTSVASGSWASASTWQGGQVPTANHVVRIAAGHTVTINDTSAVAYTIAVDGKLTFATNANTRLKVTNLQVMAGENGMGTPGVLEIGTAAAPVAANVTAEIVIANTPLGGSVADPEQFGNGLMVFGRWTAHGTLRTPTFLRLLLMSGAADRDFPPTLSIVTYGTERMDQPTLDQLCAKLPRVEFRQTFGMSELGIVRVKSVAMSMLGMAAMDEGATGAEDGSATGGEGSPTDGAPQDAEQKPKKKKFSLKDALDAAKQAIP